MLIESRDSLVEVLKQDRKNAGIGYSFKDRLRQFFFPSYSYNYVKLLRKYNYYSNKSVLLSKFYQYRLCRLQKTLGFYIPKDVFGPGLYIPHFGSIIVNPHSRIGKNCQINNNVVIGQVDGKAPEIGDNCYIGPGVVIAGNIKIGNNVWIGANAVVNKSFDVNNVLIAGVPARIIDKRDFNWLEVFNNYNMGVK